MAPRGKRGADGPVDLARVRRALAELDRIEREHPEAFDRDRAGWEAVLNEDEEMADSKVVAFRFPPELQERIDRYSARLSARAGVEVTRAQVVKKLITLGLDTAEGEEDTAKKRKK